MNLALSPHREGMKQPKEGCANARPALLPGSGAQPLCLLLPGVRLPGGLVLKELLGSGGMGSVWRARDSSPKLNLADVAVKFLDTGDGSSDAVALFAREAEATRKVQSEHVVRLLAGPQVFREYRYLVLQYLKGSTLSACVKGPMSLGFVATIMRQLCVAVSDCHEAGVVHRDVKPQNVMVQRSVDGARNVTLIDFGLARYLGAEVLASDGAASGTPFAASPDQLLLPADNDPRNDVWSLGIVAYCLLTGRAPFNGASMGEVLRAIDEQNPIPVSLVRNCENKALDAFFGRAFQSKRSARLPDVAAFAQEFTRALCLGPGLMSLRAVERTPTPLAA
jgi:eukaryotic-like serine/threonine-protein kinase